MSGRTLLGVWAHPDDETYASAGLMTEFRRRGDRVVLVMATLGEHGTSDPTEWPPHRLAALRHRELRNSLALLDVDEIHLLGYEDGGCDRRDGTEAIATHIAEIEPDLIVTFGPDGMTGHPDHRAVSAWTTDAWAMTRSTADLWYSTVTPDFHRRWNDLNERIGFWTDQPERPCTDVADLAADFTLPDDLLDVKIAALRAHTSQTRSLIEMLGAETYRDWWRTESFRSARAADRRQPSGTRGSSATMRSASSEMSSSPPPSQRMGISGRAARSTSISSPAATAPSVITRR
jgi:LmbE family N-acetylglucosaminyl deacetylase